MGFLREEIIFFPKKMVIYKIIVTFATDINLMRIKLTSIIYEILR